MKIERKNLIKNIFTNLYKFTVMMAFILGFMKIFGDDNTLTAVSIYVAIATFQYCDTGIKRKSMSIIIASLFISSTLVAYLNTVSPWLALPINLIYIFTVMTLTIEPKEFKLNIIFLLPLLFSHSMPVNADRLPMRVFSMTIGIAITLIIANIRWKSMGIGNDDGKGIAEQFKTGLKHIGVSLRMAIGISLAFLIGGIMGLEKPLWISLVVMSLTQIEADEMVKRIKHRTLGSIVGIFFVTIVFGYLVPENLIMAIVLFLGYIGFFFPEYKYKQFINFVSAISASLVLFEPNIAMFNRFASLFAGIAIVIALYIMERWITYFREFSSEHIKRFTEIFE